MVGICRVTRPATDLFVRRFDEVTITAEEIIWPGLLGPQLRLEIQYVLHCRGHQRTNKSLPTLVMTLVRALAGTDTVSLLDWTEDDWRTRIRAPGAARLEPAGATRRSPQDL